VPSIEETASGIIPLQKMDGIQYHPDESGRRNYSSSGKHEMLDAPQSAFQSSYPPQTTQTSNIQSRFSDGSTDFNAFKTPGVTYYPLSPPASDESYSPAPFAPPLNPLSYPLSPPATEWSGSPPPSASTPFPYSPSPAISTTERGNRSPTSTAVTPERFQITVRDLTGRIVTLNDITSSMKVSKLKEKFEAKEGIPTLEQKLIFEGKELTDGTVYFLLLPFFKDIRLGQEASL
jgi:hypothetical protein